MRIDSAGWTHVGRRAHNEDAWVGRGDLGLFVVADGVGGYEGGEVASRCVVDTFIEFRERVARDAEATWPHRPLPKLSPEENLLLGCARLAQRAVRARGVGALRGMSSTLVALALGPRGAAVGHIGDSRLYLLREGQLAALTRDHSLLEEMRRDGGELPARNTVPFGHIITRAVGTESAEPTLQRLAVEAGDVYLLCSDGLYEPLGPERLASGLQGESAASMAQHLVEAAYAAGGTDNITAVVVRVEER